MGDYDYLDDMFAAGDYKPYRDDKNKWHIDISLNNNNNKQNRVIQKPKHQTNFLRKNSPPKKQQMITKDENYPSKPLNLSKKRLKEIVNVYGKHDKGPGVYNFEDKVLQTKPMKYKSSDEEVMKMSSTVPASIPDRLTYTDSQKPATQQLDNHMKKKKIKKSKKSDTQSSHEEKIYTIEGLKNNPLSFSEQSYHQQRDDSNVGKKSISFSEFNGILNDTRVVSSINKMEKKNSFNVSSILKPKHLKKSSAPNNNNNSKNDSLQYSYLFSPKKTIDDPTAGMDFENITSGKSRHHNNNNNQEEDEEVEEKDSLALLESKETPQLTVKLSGGSVIHNFPEWTSLRDNYITQLQNLNYHQELTQNINSDPNSMSDISIPNFIGLLIAIRKISFRIVDRFRQVILYNEKHENFRDMNSYIIKMATDVNCINKQPFVDWMGVSPLFNTFFSSRRIDGTSALFADRVEPPKGIKFQGEYQNVKNDELRKELYRDLYGKKPIYMRRELVMTSRELGLVDELGQVVWNTYCTYQEAKHHKRAADVMHSVIGITSSENIETNDDNLNNSIVYHDVNMYNNNNNNSHEAYRTGADLENPSYVMQVASTYSAASSFTNIRPLHLKNHLKVSWKKWRKLFLVRIGLRNLQEGRMYYIKRKVIEGWQKYSWQNMEFRRLQHRRWNQLLDMCFSAWLQYMFWCRRFNQVLKMANQENMRRILKRMRVFAIYVHDNRNFKWKRAHLYLIITFRALKENAKINKFLLSQKLKRASMYTFGELNLRKYYFEKWRNYKNVSMATETIDVALLVWALRDAMGEWKSLAWPRKYKSRRGLRVKKKGMLTSGEEEVEVEQLALADTQNYSTHVKNNTLADSNHKHLEASPEHNKWHMAAFMDGGSGSENGSLQGDNKTTATKKSWFSNFLSK